MTNSTLYDKANAVSMSVTTIVLSRHIYQILFVRFFDNYILDYFREIILVISQSIRMYMI